MADNDKTVLIVVDDESLRAIAAKLVQSRGYRTLEASDGNEAIDILKGGAHVDLFVLDIVMPSLDGLQTVEQARKLPGFGSTPVVLLTAQKKDDDIHGGYRKGATIYLTKPLRPAHLTNAVDYLIGDLSAEERTRLELLL